MMSYGRYPTFLYGYRAAQIVFAVVVIATLANSLKKPGFWVKLSGAAAGGFIAVRIPQIPQVAWRADSGVNYRQPQPSS